MSSASITINNFNLILGDWNYKLTKKGFESRIKMLDVYKETLEMKNQISLKKNEKEK